MAVHSRVAAEAMQAWTGLQRVSSLPLTVTRTWKSGSCQTLRTIHSKPQDLRSASGKLPASLPFGRSIRFDINSNGTPQCMSMAGFSCHKPFSTSSSTTDGEKSPEPEADPHAEEQEREHVFTSMRDLDVVDRLDSHAHHMSLDQVSDSCMQSIGDSVPTSNIEANYVEGHNSSGGVSLSGVMQSNVPEPFQSSIRGSPTHMNMPGGGSRSHDKYLAGHIKDVHPSRQYSTAAGARSQEGGITSEEDPTENLYTPYSDMQGLQGDLDLSVRDLVHLENPCPQGVQGEGCEHFKLWLNNCIRYGLADCEDNLAAFRAGRKTLPQIFAEQEEMIKRTAQQYRRYSTSARRYTGGPKDNNADSVSNSVEGKLSQKDKLKRAVKEYGGTVVVFHVTISLMSLGTAYLAVSSGLDVVGLLEKVGVGQSVLESRLATGTGTFVVAYAVHKVFAPARIATTLTCTPFIVRYLRRIGFLKPPKV